MVQRKPNTIAFAEFAARARGLDFDDKYSHKLNPDYREKYGEHNKQNNTSKEG